MTILYKHETSMIIEVNVIYVLITKSQGSTTSDLCNWKNQGNFLMPGIPDHPNNTFWFTASSMNVQRVRLFLWGEIPSSKVERKLLWKIDWFILSYCCLMVRFAVLIFNSKVPIYITAVLHELWVFCV